MNFNNYQILPLTLIGILLCCAGFCCCEKNIERFCYKPCRKRNRKVIPLINHYNITINEID